MEITIREFRPGRWVACLPGAERIGSPVESHVEAEAQVAAYANGHALEPVLTGTKLVDADGEVELAPLDVPEGYRVETASGWFALIGSDGEQVGKSKRSREEAIAELAAE